jgi:hypothetical protein
MTDGTLDTVLYRYPEIELPEIDFEQESLKVLFNDEALREHHEKNPVPSDPAVLAAEMLELFPVEPFIVKAPNPFGAEVLGLIAVNDIDGYVGFECAFYQYGGAVTLFEDSVRRINTSVQEGVSVIMNYDGDTIPDNERKMVSWFYHFFMISIYTLLTYAEEYSFYPVEEKPVSVPRKPGKNKKKIRENPGRILYLNRIPSASKGSKAPKTLDAVEDSEGRMPHQRRAHKRTLRDPRYKNHAKYLVEKGVKVKQAWIGNETSVTRGNTYRVILER